MIAAASTGLRLALAVAPACPTAATPRDSPRASPQYLCGVRLAGYLPTIAATPSAFDKHVAAGKSGAPDASCNLELPDRALGNSDRRDARARHDGPGDGPRPRRLEQEMRRRDRPIAEWSGVHEDAEPLAARNDLPCRATGRARIPVGRGRQRRAGAAPPRLSVRKPGQRGHVYEGQPPRDMEVLSLCRTRFIERLQ